MPKSDALIKEIAEKADCLPAPALAVGEKGEILYRNRLAKRLLPVSGRLRPIIEKALRHGETFSCATLDQVSYYMFFFRERKSTVHLLVLMENTLLFHPGFDAYLMEEGLNLAKEILNVPKTESGSEVKTVAFFDRLAARTRRFREEGRLYRNYLMEEKRTRSDAFSCDLSSFITSLAEKLEPYRLRLTYRGKEGLCVFASPEDIVYCVLNLVQFAFVFEGERNLEICARKTARKVIFSVRLLDRENLFSSFSDLMWGNVQKKGGFSAAMGIPPLLSLALFCRREKERFLLRKEGEMCILEFSLPQTDLSSVGFLGTKSRFEQVLLDRIVREYFD